MELVYSSFPVCGLSSSLATNAPSDASLLRNKGPVRALPRALMRMFGIKEHINVPAFPVCRHMNGSAGTGSRSGNATCSDLTLPLPDTWTLAKPRERAGTRV